MMSKKTLSVTFPESPAEARAAKERRVGVVMEGEESVSLRGAATEGVEQRCAGDDDEAWAMVEEERVEAERTAETTTERAPRVVASVDACFFVSAIGVLRGARDARVREREGRQHEREEAILGMQRTTTAR